MGILDYFKKPWNSANPQRLANWLERINSTSKKDLKILIDLLQDEDHFISNHLSMFYEAVPLVSNDFVLKIITEHTDVSTLIEYALGKISNHEIFEDIIKQSEEVGYEYFLNPEIIERISDNNILERIYENLRHTDAVKLRKAIHRKLGRLESQEALFDIACYDEDISEVKKAISRINSESKLVDISYHYNYNEEIQNFIIDRMSEDEYLYKIAANLCGRGIQAVYKIKAENSLKKLADNWKHNSDYMTAILNRITDIKTLIYWSEFEFQDQIMTGVVDLYEVQNVINDVAKKRITICKKLKDKDP